MNFKINDWVKHKETGLKGKVIANKNNYYKIKCNNSKIIICHKKELQRYSYIHKEIELGIFRFSFFKLSKRWTVRFELSKGWD